MSETTNASDQSERTTPSAGPVGPKSAKDVMRPQTPPKAPKRSRHRKNFFVVVLNFFFGEAAQSDGA